MRKAASLVTWLMVAATLLGLAGTTGAAVLAIARANDRVTEQREVLTSFAGLQEAVAQEAFAEAGYRRAPGEAAWLRVEAAIAEVPDHVRELRPLVGREDALTLSRLTVLNARYAAQVRASRERPLASADDRVAGPALDSINRLLSSTLDRHRQAVTDATRRQEALIGRLAVLLAVVFLIAFGVLGWAFRMTLLEQRRLRHEAESHRARSLTDHLTGLPNRAALLASMEADLGSDTADSALLFLDLDRFKPVNDTWGHHAGDEVLRQVARRLLGAVRSGDLAARLGGDEFAIFLPRGSETETVIARVLAAFEEPFEVEGRPVQLGTSIGVADTRTAGHDPDGLLRAADEALYRAKGAGRGRAEAHEPA